MHWYKFIFLFMAWYKVHLKETVTTGSTMTFKIHRLGQRECFVFIQFYKVFPIRSFSSESSTRGLEGTWQKAGKCSSSDFRCISRSK